MLAGCRAAVPTQAGDPWWQQEDWLGDTVDSCPRVRALDAPRPYAPTSGWAASDGGGAADASTAAYVFADGEAPIHIHSVRPRPALGHRSQVRLPERIGNRVCGVHEGELLALHSCVAACPSVDRCVVGVDRRSRLDLVESLPRRSARDTIKCNFPALKTRLRREKHIAKQNTNNRALCVRDMLFSQ